MRCKKGLPERESFFGKLKLKKNTSEQLVTQAEELGVENASTLRKQEIL